MDISPSSNSCLSYNPGKGSQATLPQKQLLTERLEGTKLALTATAPP